MREDLDRLAAEGFEAVPPVRLDELAQWCWEWCEATGDARFCSIARTLSPIAAWWSEYEAVPARLGREIELQLRRLLADVLRAEDAAAGSGVARSLRPDLVALLLPPRQWDPYLHLDDA